MVDDIFSGLLEGVAGLIAEVVGEVVGESIGCGVEGLSGGGSGSEKEDVAGVIERYKFLPKDVDH